MTRTVVHLTIPHLSAGFAGSLLTSLRPQLRDHGVTFVGDGDLPTATSDVAAVLAELVDREQARTSSLPRGRKDTVLISSARVLGATGHETIDRLDPALLRTQAVAGLRRLIDMLGASRVRVVMHIRRQDALLELGFAQLVARGIAGTLEDHFPLRQPPVWDYLPLVTAVSELSGVSDVVVRPHELEDAGTEVFVRDLLDAARVSEQVSLSAVRKLTPERGLARTPLLMAAKMNAHLDTPAELRLVHDFLRGTFGEAGERPAGVLDPDERRRIVRDYASSNAVVFGRFASDLAASSYADDTSTAALGERSRRPSGSSITERGAARVAVQWRRGQGRLRQRFSNDDGSGK